MRIIKNYHIKHQHQQNKDPFVLSMITKLHLPTTGSSR